MKKTPVVQLVDCEAFEERFDVTWANNYEVKRFEMSQRRNDPSEPVYVGVVSITRHYGGREEGGWYYDWHQVEEIVQAKGFRHLLSMVRTLREQYPTCPRGRYSVIGGADTIVYMSRNRKLIEKLQSTERPRYE